MAVRSSAVQFAGCLSVPADYYLDAERTQLGAIIALKW